MSIRVAINGFGRIGRNCLRAIYEMNKENDIVVVAINDTSPLETNAHLLRYDSTHGRFSAEVSTDSNHLIVNDHKIICLANRNASELPWKELNIDVVYECTGHFTERNMAEQHLAAGARKVLISAPAKDADATIVYGVNHSVLKKTDTLVSNASCTTNCLAPVVKALHDVIGIEQGLMTTIHALTNDQSLLDAGHKDLHRARAAMASLIPTKTGAAAAIGLVLPELKGCLDGLAIRVPTLNVSLVDLTFNAKRNTTVEEINTVLKDAALKGPLKGILWYNDEPLVSIDFNHTSASSIFDATQTRVNGKQAKVLAWYDNEWGFCCRMLDTSLAMMDAK
ncbi:MAG: gapA [Gammaproteobacteria bacterium]|jgi:glyceraldehyde 3-phosphate dehydrogenase|nr:gapA [Gammaproteobacteria bacterium]